MRYAINEKLSPKWFAEGICRVFDRKVQSLKFRRNWLSMKTCPPKTIMIMNDKAQNKSDLQNHFVVNIKELGIEILKKIPEKAEDFLCRFIDCGHEKILRKSRIVEKMNVTTDSGQRRKYLCPECKQISLNLLRSYESRIMKFDLLDESAENRRCQVYRCRVCSTRKEAQAGNVQRQKLRCQNCFHLAHYLEALEKWMVFLGPSDKGPAYYHYEFIKCHHGVDCTRQSVKEGSPVCPTCWELELAKIAKLANVVILGKSAVKEDCYRMRILTCSHIVERPINALRQNRLFCEACHELTLEKEAMR